MAPLTRARCRPSIRSACAAIFGAPHRRATPFPPRSLARPGETRGIYQMPRAWIRVRCVRAPTLPSRRRCRALLAPRRNTLCRWDLPHSSIHRSPPYQTTDPAPLVVAVCRGMFPRRSPAADRPGARYCVEQLPEADAYLHAHTSHRASGADHRCANVSIRSCVLSWRNRAPRGRRLDSQHAERLRRCILMEA